MASFRGALIISFAQKYSELLITLIANIIVARLLTPEEIGIFSVTSAITVIAHMFRDLGVSQYLVKEKDLGKEKLSAAFTVTLFSSYLIGAVLFVSRELISSFFERPELVEVVSILALNFFLIPFGSVALGILRRNMCFSALYKINVSSSFANASCSVILALQGYSYMSLAYASLIGICCTVLLATIYRPRDSFVFLGFKGISDVLRFGTLNSYAMILNQFVYHLPEILIGKFFGMTSVGLYSKGQGVNRLFHTGVMQAILPVVLPHFSGTIKQGKNISADYLNLLSSINCISMPFFVYLILEGEDIIQLLFGEQWIAAVTFLSFIAFAQIINKMYALTYDTFVALGRIDLYAKNQSVIQIFAIGLYVISSLQSLDALLLSLVIVEVFACLITYRALITVLSISYGDVLANLLKPALIALIIFLLLYLAKHTALDGVFYVVRLLVLSVLTGLFWVGCQFAFKTHLKGEIMRLLGFLGRK